VVVTDNSSRVKLSFTQLEKLMAWLRANEVTKDQLIEIKESQTGIGPHTRAEVEMNKDEGLYIDLTDYDSW
jgi:hypothetical protein